MSTSCANRLNSCLRAARKAAGYTNYGQAGVAAHRSPEVIGRQERGDSPINMMDAIEYAHAYERPEIMMTFCQQCPIRKQLFGIETRCEGELPLSALRVSNRLRQAARYADRLAEILDDGHVDRTEIGSLCETLDYLKSINAVWRELYTSCMEAGLVSIKKDRSAGTETAYANKITRQSYSCCTSILAQNSTSVKEKHL